MIMTIIIIKHPNIPLLLKIYHFMRKLLIHNHFKILKKMLDIVIVFVIREFFQKINFWLSLP